MKLLSLKNGRSRVSKCLVLLVSALVISTNLAFCQEKTEDTSPEAAGQKSFTAMKEGKAEDYARMMAPGELLRFKNAMLVIVDMAQEKGQEKQVLPLFDAPDVESVKKLEPVEFIAKIMKKQMTPEVTQLYSKAKFDMLGHVMEGDDVAHCVYRLTIPDLLTKVDIVNLKKEGSVWGMLLSSDLDKMLQMLKVSFARDPKSALDLNPQLTDVKLLGRVVNGDTAYVVFRSTTTILGAPIEKVGQLAFEKAEPEWKLVMNDDNNATQEMIKEKLAPFIEAGKRAAERARREAEASEKPAAKTGAAASKSTVKKTSGASKSGKSPQKHK